MKIQIRQSVFETNSSSVHAITICTKEEYDKFVKKELLYNYYDNKLEDINELKDVDYDELKKKYPEWDSLSLNVKMGLLHTFLIDDEEYLTYPEYLDKTNNYERFVTFHDITDEKGYTIPAVAFGYSGWS